MPAETDLEVVGSGRYGAEPDWNQAPLGDLINHIEDTHHKYMRDEIPRISAMIQQAASEQGNQFLELLDLQREFAAFAADINSHMTMEETVLFPCIRDLELSRGSLQGTKGTLGLPITCLVDQHDEAGESLDSLRQLTNDFTPPPGAGTTYQALIAALIVMEADMHQHVHKENNILFPRALVLEAQ